MPDAVLTVRVGDSLHRLASLSRLLPVDPPSGAVIQQGAAPTFPFWTKASEPEFDA